MMIEKMSKKMKEESLMTRTKLTKWPTQNKKNLYKKKHTKQENTYGRNIYAQNMTLCEVFMFIFKKECL